MVRDLSLSILIAFGTQYLFLFGLGMVNGFDLAFELGTSGLYIWTSYVVSALVFLMTRILVFIEKSQKYIDFGNPNV